MRAALRHQGLVLRRSCRFRMALALNTSAGTVQCRAGGAGACGVAVCVGASPHPSCDKVSSPAALGWGGERRSEAPRGIKITLRVFLAPK